MAPALQAALLGRPAPASTAWGALVPTVGCAARTLGRVRCVGCCHGEPWHQGVREGHGRKGVDVQEGAREGPGPVLARGQEAASRLGGQQCRVWSLCLGAERPHAGSARPRAQRLLSLILRDRDCQGPGDLPPPFSKIILCVESASQGGSEAAANPLFYK